ncbi:MAG: hypothetical protein Q8N59_02715 [bacterium]|nr:hypothetical protein [bacterium]
MGSELEILKKIWGNEKKASAKLISGQTGLGLDYIRYLCNCLIKKKQIKPVRKKPDWYRITAKGKKELKLLGIFKPKILKEDKGLRKIILPWSKGLLKVRLPKGKEIPVEEKRLRLGKMIEKTISFLKASTFSAKGRKRRKRLQPTRHPPTKGRHLKRKKHVKRRKIKSS